MTSLPLNYNILSNTENENYYYYGFFLKKTCQCHLEAGYEVHKRVGILTLVSTVQIDV